MYTEKLQFNIDWKRKTLHVYQENDETQQINIDEEGNGVLALGLFKIIDIGSLKLFMKHIEEILTKEQKQKVLFLWGNATAIKLGAMADTIGDRLLAKEVITIGLQKGIIVPGVNSTYRVVHKEEQRTMKEYAARMKEGNFRKGTGTIHEYTEKETKEEGMIESSVEAGLAALTEKNDKNIIENIASGKVTPLTEYKKPTDTKTVKVSIESLKKELVALEKKLSDTKDNEWNEEETPHTVIDKINKLKNQIRMCESGASNPANPSHTKVLPTKKPVPQKLPARKPAR